jgi:Spy/CpxP family protein refolding chaperone
MKNTLLKQSLFALAATAGLLTVVTAAAPSSGADPAVTPGQHEHRHMGRDGMRDGMRGGMMDPFMMAVHQLDLTPEQQQSVHSILDTAHAAMQGQMERMGENLAILGNPGDPGYAAAVQAAKTKAGEMIQHRSDVDVQVYSVLSAEQKAKLPQLLGDMKAKFEQRRDDWQQHRGKAQKPQT